MYVLFDKVARCNDLYFTDDDILNKTPVGIYVEKMLKTQRNNFYVFTNQEHQYYKQLYGKEIIYNDEAFSDFAEEAFFNTERVKLNNAKHVNKDE